VVIDPKKELPDVNPGNNIWQAEKPETDQNASEEK
jgi:hypothetical protein